MCTPYIFKIIQRDYPLSILVPLIHDNFSKVNCLVLLHSTDTAPFHPVDKCKPSSCAICLLLLLPHAHNHTYGRMFVQWQCRWVNTFLFINAWYSILSKSHDLSNQFYLDKHLGSTSRACCTCIFVHTVKYNSKKMSTSAIRISNSMGNFNRNGCCPTGVLI